ncbi:expressed unknown protein [Seminavis robusta]|uniref:Uncharacterized protein n=1 Tax=Seminavis robusta TaxID=568900 RepID=A0A9N8EDI5_9STRA|nr:expressed unknown protein [Seminavis robusta]|eukprot:Sro1018_g231890.1 n/a (384) ;mRNA; r:30554-31705
MMVECRLKKRVRFSDRRQVVLLEDNTSSSSSNGVSPKVDHRKGARECAHRLISKGYGHLLKGSFEGATDDNTTTDVTQENLNSFVAGIPDRDNVRGLEIYMSPPHREERDMAHEDVVEAVLSKQSQLARRRARQTSFDPSDQLRAASRKYSRTSRVFARRMGIADELAVQEDEALPQQQQQPQPRCHSLSQQPPQRPQLLQQQQQPQKLSKEAGPEMTSLSSLFRRGDSAHTTNSNARMARRQPSTRQLDTGIRSMAASMNAKKASRQESIRQLNVSIRNLSFQASSHQCFHHHEHSDSSFSEMDGSGFESDVSIIHPSLAVSHRDRALKIPGRPAMTKVSDCANLIQSALDLVDCSTEIIAEDEPDGLLLKQGRARSCALSA